MIHIRRRYLNKSSIGIQFRLPEFIVEHFTLSAVDKGGKTFRVRIEDRISFYNLKILYRLEFYNNKAGKRTNTVVPWLGTDWIVSTP